MNDEEVAFRIVRLYFEEIARFGFKRSLDLDQIINSYFYTLNKLKGKDAAMKKIIEKVVKEEKIITSKERSQEGKQLPKLLKASDFLGKKALVWQAAVSFRVK